MNGYEAYMTLCEVSDRIAAKYVIRQKDRGYSRPYTTKEIVGGSAAHVGIGAAIGALKGARNVSKLKKAGASEEEIAAAKKNIGKKALKGAAIGAISGGINAGSGVHLNKLYKQGDKYLKNNPGAEEYLRSDNL